MCLHAKVLNNADDPASIHMLANVFAHMHACGYTPGPKSLLRADTYTCGCIRIDIRMYADTHDGMPTTHMCLHANVLNNVVDPANNHVIANVSAHIHACGYTCGSKTLLPADTYTCGCIRINMRMYADTHGGMPTTHVHVHVNVLNNVVDPASIHMTANVSAHIHVCG